MIPIPPHDYRGVPRIPSHLGTRERCRPAPPLKGNHPDSAYSANTASVLHRGTLSHHNASFKDTPSPPKVTSQALCRLRPLAPLTPLAPLHHLYPPSHPASGHARAKVNPSAELRPPHWRAFPSMATERRK